MASTPETVRLRDGRRLSYAEYGELNGKPVFYFHGFPSSRLSAKLAEETARRDGVRLIAVDRPGIGMSDYVARRGFSDWPDDVVQVADALGIQRFAIVGVSGGGPYAAACARKIPERIIAVAIVSGAGPFDVPASAKGVRPLSRFFARLNGRFPWLMIPGMWLFSLAVRLFPRRMVRLMSRSMAPYDKRIMARPEVIDTLSADMREAFRQGHRGPLLEAALYQQPWDFRLEEITMEVHLWQGEADSMIPPSMGRYQAQAMPNCHARFYPDEGHLLVIERMGEINRALFPAG